MLVLRMVEVSKEDSVRVVFDEVVAWRVVFSMLLELTLESRMVLFWMEEVSAMERLMVLEVMFVLPRLVLSILLRFALVKNAVAFTNPV